jgi:polysaccharide biosynthesis/export protein
LRPWLHRRVAGRFVHPLVALGANMMSTWFGRAVLAGLVSLCFCADVFGDDVAYTVKPGDVLLVSVWKEPDLQGQALVMPDGAFAFPLLGQVDARGKTVAELQQIVTKRLSTYISDPVVSISVQEIKGNKVYVLGQVNRPGEFIVNPRVNVMQALSMAGGTTAFAATNDIIILRGVGRDQVALPFKYSEVARGKSLEQNIDLQAGDVVVVP